MSTKASERLSGRERLLAAADQLFYEEGVHTVGIDRVIERAGVAKATLYSTFGSKDELVRCYLVRRHEERRERITRKLERYDTPHARLLGVFDIMRETFVDTGYRGCAFQNASAETPSGGAVQEVSDMARGWVRSLFTDLSRDAGVADPAALAAKLVILYDGAVVGARMDRDPGSAVLARLLAEDLLDAAPQADA